jgi:nicotinamidase-related amidase
MSLRRRVRRGLSKREDFPLEPDKAALLIIDIQRYLSPSEDKDDKVDQEDDEKTYYYRKAFWSAVDNIRKLCSAFRSIRDHRAAGSSGDETTGGCEVVFVYLQAATKDGRDISLDYKLSGPALANIPTVDTPQNDLFLPECSPSQEGKGDILLPKTSCSVFQSTNLDYLLRNLQIEQLVIAGQMTDQCVESAVRDAADLGYLVTVADDACAARSETCHARGLDGMKGFCRIAETGAVLKELRATDQSAATKEGTEEEEEEARLPVDPSFVVAAAEKTDLVAQEEVQQDKSVSLHSNPQSAMRRLQDDIAEPMQKLDPKEDERRRLLPENPTIIRIDGGGASPRQSRKDPPGRERACL